MPAASFCLPPPKTADSAIPRTFLSRQLGQEISSTVHHALAVTSRRNGYDTHRNTLTRTQASRGNVALFKSIAMRQSRELRGLHLLADEGAMVLGPCETDPRNGLQLQGAKSCQAHKANGSRFEDHFRSALPAPESSTEYNSNEQADPQQTRSIPQGQTMAFLAPQTGNPILPSCSYLSTSPGCWAV